MAASVRCHTPDSSGVSLAAEDFLIASKYFPKKRTLRNHWGYWAVFFLNQMWMMFKCSQTFPIFSIHHVCWEEAGTSYTWCADTFEQGSVASLDFPRSTQRKLHMTPCWQARVFWRHGHGYVWAGWIALVVSLLYMLSPSEEVWRSTCVFLLEGL